MVKRRSDMTSEVRERMREGRGTVELLHVFRQEELRGKARLFARLRIPRGSGIGFHRHDGEEEIFYILSGEGVVNDNGETKRVGAGDAVLTGGGAGHAIENQGEEPLELMAVILQY
jgi:mannose-6-phosphate isomerase-like protein (cupin superfamily)